MSNPMNPDQDKSMLDRAKDMAGGLKDKVEDLFDGDDDKAGRIEQVGDEVDERTGGRFGEQIDAAQDAARDRLGNQKPPQ